MSRGNRLMFMLSVAGLAAAIVFFLNTYSQNDHHPANTSYLTSMIEKLPKRTGNHPRMHLADNLIPPTNKWFSSLVFSPNPEPVFAYPLSYKPTIEGFEISNPRITSVSDAIFAPHVPDVRVQFDYASYEVSYYDDLSVVVTYHNDAGQYLISTRITQGSPFIFVDIHQPAEVTLVSRWTPEQLSDTHYITSDEFITYGLRFPLFPRLNGNTFSFNPKADDKFAIFTMPANTASDTYFEAAGSPISSTAVSYTMGGNSIHTTYTFETDDGRPTLFATLPHHGVQNTETLSGSFMSLYGSQAIHKGKLFDSKLPVPDLSDTTLNLQRLTDPERQELAQHVKADTATTTLSKTDTYFGGKELYRAANLLEIAAAIGLDQETNQLEDKLQTALSDWLSLTTDNKRYFYYDETIQGIVGVEPAFGSEQFNDHHFHYGYFIYAASILGKHRPEFIDMHREAVNLLVADIANPEASDVMPKFRVFDLYTGHSWASGYGNFADGNNQESSSEAVNAWYAVYKWADLINDETLKQHATWLYAQESIAAQRYWLNPDLQTFDKYSHRFISLVWNGKRDYATFFSPRPQAKLGIQLIPMSSAQTYLKDLPNKKELLRAVLPDEQSINGQFGDYLTMFEAWEDPQTAMQKAKVLPSEHIDDGNSRSYMLAYIYSRFDRE